MKVADYFRLGWSLIPIANGKIPAIPWKQYQTSPATKDEIKQWHANGWTFGLVTGQLSGITVIDDDRVKHGLNEWGIASSVIAKTKSGGKHYYFKHNHETNTANPTTHLDIRGEGGYVKLPPFDGYEWISAPTADNISRLTIVPIDLLQAIKPIERIGEQVSLSDIVGMQKGARDDSLLRLANSLCNKYRPQEWETGVLPILFSANNTFQPPLPEPDVMRIFNQATRFVANHPPAVLRTLDVPKVAPAPHQSAEVAKLRAADRKLEALAPHTGYPDLDVCYRGLVPGRLAVLCGDTNVGKTAFACNLAHRVTLQNKSVLYFALEPDHALIDYLVSIQKAANFDDITDDEIQNYNNPHLKIYSADQVRTLDELVSTVNTLERFDLICVDHFGYFTRSSTENFTAKQSEALQRLALLAQEKMTHVMLIAHLNKTFDVSPKKWIPTMNQISGSAAFKQDADDVLLLARRPEKGEYNTLQYTDEGVVVVAKTKSPKGRNIAPIIFDPHSAMIWGRSDPDYVKVKQDRAWLHQAKESLGIYETN